MTYTELLKPDHLTPRADALTRPSPIPARPGVYGWYFDVPPTGVPLEGTQRTEFGCLLYVGIAPREPRRSDSRPSSQNLRRRIRNHFSGNSSGSTLRRSLGALLASELDIQLRRSGESERLTFGAGEAALSDWMSEHARVCWLVNAEPWRIETELISELVLPLNLDQNKHSAFHATLSAARAEQKRIALELPVIPSRPRRR